MKYKNEPIKILAYRIICYHAYPSKDGVIVEIPIKSIKNNERVCSHCKERNNCISQIKNKKRVHFYKDIQANIKRQLPIEYTTRR